MTENKYTPEKICADKTIRFNIPIYQRLFSWDKENIEELLSNMKDQFNKSKDSPYYIGMLTMHNKDLVDGQQRFTVLSIIATVFQEHYPEWSKMKGKLHLSARPDDEEYLKSLFGNQDKDGIVNKKMFDGQGTIKSWIKEHEKDICIKDFCKYVYEKCTFFIAFLPGSYKNNTQDLNKYFEAMNSTGKNLEAHEIIKVQKYLKAMTCEQDFYNAIWNLVSDMDKPLIRKKTKTESEDDFRKRYNDSINKFQKNIENRSFNNLLNDFSINNEKSDYKTIRELKADGHNPDVRRQDKYYGEGTHSMLNFPEFLLQILYITLENKERTDVNVNEFFDVHNLQETVSNYTKKWTEYEWKNFGKELLRYRLIFDYYVIRIPNSEIGDYRLDYSDMEGSEIDSSVISQIQSLLYVDSSSKTYYRWIVPFLDFLRQEKDISPNSIFKELQSIDNEIYEHSELFLDNEESYSFGGRRTVYFLRRLDFYLWLENHNTRNTSDKSYSIINKFKFKRSINSQEHLHPQNDENRTGYEPWKAEKHKFGNLFLISSSFNSSQSDDTINTKFGRIKDQIEYTPSIESIKLYKIYTLCNKDEQKWNLETMKQHQENMIQFLRDSYNDVSYKCNCVE